MAAVAVVVIRIAERIVDISDLDTWVRPLILSTVPTVVTGFEFT